MPRAITGSPILNHSSLSFFVELGWCSRDVASLRRAEFKMLTVYERLQCILEQIALKNLPSILFAYKNRHGRQEVEGPRCCHKPDSSSHSGWAVQTGRPAAGRRSGRSVSRGSFPGAGGAASVGE